MLQSLIKANFKIIQFWKHARILSHNDPKWLTLDVHKSGTIYSLSEKKRTIPLFQKFVKRITWSSTIPVRLRREKEIDPDAPILNRSFNWSINKFFI